MHYLVDGMNLIGSRPDGWWRDRPKARRDLVRTLAPLARLHGLTLVFDGRPQPGELEEALGAGVEVRFAPGGPDAADRAIAELVRVSDAPAEIAVVTSDARLADEVRRLGAQVVGVSAFRRDLGQ